MLRDDRQVAVDDVIVALENACDAYADASELLAREDAAMASRFEALARRRAGLAQRLSNHLRAMGDLPSEPDRDRETLDTLVRHVRAHFAGGERDELLSEMVAHEEEIASKIATALAAAPPDDAVATLQEAAEEVRRALRSAAG